MAQPEPMTPVLDLTVTPPGAVSAFALPRTRTSGDSEKLLEALGETERPRERVRRISEVMRKQGTGEVVDLLTAAGRSSLELEPPGLRLLFGFLEVKRPGLEVLRQLEGLSSMRRVWLKILMARWTEPEESENAGAFLAVMDALEEGARVGILELDLRDLPRHPTSVKLVHDHLEQWFRGMRVRLEKGERLSEEALYFITQLSMTEINLLEKRISRLASVIDPYDAAAMARLLPVLSRYDQDIEHLKTVVSRLTTYAPFHERLLTLEHALSSSEMDKIVKGLGGRVATQTLARIVTGMREHPVLSREFAALTALVHRTSFLRSRILMNSAPDLHSSLLRILTFRKDDEPFLLGMEPEVGIEIWPRLESWGCLARSPGVFEIPIREDRSLEFVHPDGTPRLDVEEDQKPELTLKQLVATQIQNDVFLLGVLENPRAIALPGVVELIASRCRSLRVLDKIVRVRSLYTGLVNRNVPAALLSNPANIPMQSLRRLIHVRFVSKIDLQQMARSPVGKRPEVIREIRNYLDSLMK